MVICPNCGKAFEDGARFCNECGTKLPEAPVAPAAPAANVCPNCKTALNDDAAFCPVCARYIVCLGPQIHRCRKDATRPERQLLSPAVL